MSLTFREPQRGNRIPAQGNALGYRATPSPRSEGTPSTIGGGNHCPITVYAPFLQNGWGISFRFPGLHPGLYALPRWGTEEGWYARPRWGQFPQLHLHLLPVGAKTSED